MRVAVLGASSKPERYSYKAVKALAAAGHEVIPVNPAVKEVCGIRVAARIGDIKGRIDTVTLYVGPERLESLAEDIISAKPARIIANPGAESEKMRKLAGQHGIIYMEACTLVMLSTGQF